MAISSTQPTVAISQSGTDNKVQSAQLPAALTAGGNLKVALQDEVPSLDFHRVSAGSTNAEVVKASAGKLYGVKGFNNAAYPIFIKFYNKATAPNPASDAVIRTVACQSGLRFDDAIPKGLAFATGIGIAVVKGIDDTDATAVLASDVVYDVDYI